MKYLHIMPPSQRMMLTYIEMLRKYFPAEDHKIQLISRIGKVDSCLLLYDNVRTYESLGKKRTEKLASIRKELAEADRIVFHSFMPPAIWKAAFLMEKDVFSKAIWVVWGIDLYNYETKGNDFISKELNKIDYEMRARIKYPIVVSEADMDEYRTRFGTHPVLYAPYAFADMRFIVMDEAMRKRKETIEAGLPKGAGDAAAAEEENKADEKQTSNEAVAPAEKPLFYVPYELGGALRVQVCHNGFPFNKHFEVLNYLTPLCQGKNRDKIKLFLPLNYGNGALANGVTYVDALKSFVNQKFAENVEIISRMMPNNEYTEYLSSIDVAIFNAPRHNALGNILQLLYMGKKVYLSSKSPLLPYLRGKGFIIHTVDELDGITLEELARPDDTQKNREWIRKAFGVETMCDLWRAIFAYSEGKISYPTAWKKDEQIMRGLNGMGET